MNDMQRLEDIFKQHGNTLAAMLIEPIQGNCCSIIGSVGICETRPRALRPDMACC